MALEQIGFQAVIQGLGTFLSGTAQMEKAQGRVEESTKKTSTAFGAFQKIALASAAAGAAAVLGLGVASLKMAADFDKGMREVNSIAKLSESAFKQLEKDTLAFSKQMGIAANEVVPALYQALSAGVPTDNVFEFMRVAGEAAIGGVTTLETAVDGLTSVVNAYGAADLSAARAADIMFKAVELGKTTFEELSMNLADVVPTAVAAGVSFQEVAAAIATLTVQGIRTTIATTGLNQALVELQKPMPPLAALMEKAAKKIGAADGSFKSMKASGASLETILLALEDAAAEMGLSLQQVFSSVEASRVVLSLTGKNAETAAKQFDQVTNSTGSARAAFEELNKSAARQFEMLKTKITATMIELGTKAIPLVISGLEKLNALFPTMVAGGTKLASALASIAKFAADNKIQVGLFIGILAVPKILGAASALLQVAGAMRGIAAARIGQAAADYRMFAASLAGAPMLTRSLGPLLLTLGSLAGPLALGGVAIAAVAASIGIEKFIPFLSKGESAADRFKKGLQELKDRLADINRSLLLGNLDKTQAAILNVANVMERLTGLGAEYVRQQDQIEKAKGLLGAENAAIATEAAYGNLAESVADVLREVGLTEPEIRALTLAMAEAAPRSREATEAVGGYFHGLELAYPATTKFKNETKAAVEALKASRTPLEIQAEQFAEIAKQAGAAELAVKGYDDVTKAITGALTKEQLVADAEIISLKKRRQDLILAGQADSQEVKNIDARIQRIEDEREAVRLTAAEIVAKGRVQESLNKQKEGEIDTDREVLAGTLDLVEATKADVAVEREALGIYPLVTQAKKDQGVAAETSAGQVEVSAGRMEAALKGPQQEAEELAQLLRDEGLAAEWAVGPIEAAFARIGIAIQLPRGPAQELNAEIAATGPTAIAQIPSFDALGTRGRADEDLLIRGMDTLSRGIVGLGPAVLAQGSFFTRFAAIANAALASIILAKTREAIDALTRALAGIGAAAAAAPAEGRQFGGPVAAGRPMWVGETQPEIWIPRSPGIVARPQQLQLGGAGLGGPTYSPQFNFNGPNVDQARAMFHRFVEDFFRRANAGAVGAGNSIYSGIG